MTADKIRLDPETHTYWLGERQVPGYTQIAKDLGIIKENPFYTDEGRAEGQALHLWFKHLASGLEVKRVPDPRIVGRVQAIQKFLSETGFKMTGGEEAQYDPVTGFACTPDIWGTLGVWTWVIDLKRGAKMKSHALQTAAQTIALQANGFRAQKRGCLYLRETGDYRLDEHKDQLDIIKWRGFVYAYQTKKEFI